jgi:UDPglucose 6-dehydrogenase
LCGAPERLLLMDARSAELTKYAANAMLAARVSLMNELARLAESVGADIEAVRRGVGTDARIGPAFLQAGVGFGGSCLPKDLRALARLADDYGVPSEIVTAVRRVNDRQKQVLFDKISRHFDAALCGRRVAVWGLAFKANTDDLREAPSLILIRMLLDAGATVHAYDPGALAAASRWFDGEAGFVPAASARAACAGADVLAVLTEWPEFRAPDLRWLARTLRHRALFDGRNLYDPVQVEAAGLGYHGIGRGRGGEDLARRPAGAVFSIDLA